MTRIVALIPAEHQMGGEPTRPVIWHRYLAGTRVVVTTPEGAQPS